MDQTFKCDDCARSPELTEIAPMLHDDVWRKLAGPRQKLCAQCMFVRAAARNVRLTLESLKPCQLNLTFSPVSWFDLFAAIETKPLANLDPWRVVATELRDAAPPREWITGKVTHFFFATHVR